MDLGVNFDDFFRLINTYLHGLHITEHANKQTRHLSGGTKRKLSYAIAMLGSPKVVLLDGKFCRARIIFFGGSCQESSVRFT